jgi:retron-type reverse transcriptase
VEINVSIIGLFRGVQRAKRTDRREKVDFLQFLCDILSRGHKFVRYADDFMMYCKSLKAAERVKRSITDLPRLKLKRKVNQDKSAVSRPWLVKFYGKVER